MIVNDKKEIEWKSCDKEYAVRRIHDLGYNVIPCVDKVPKVGWKRYQTKRVRDNDIGYWLTNPFQQSPLSFFLLTGHCPYSEAVGLVVLDGDDPAACELVETLCPFTPLQTKTSRGRHYFYRCPADDIRSRGKTKIVNDGIPTTYNLDVKANGGYVVAPGGVKYQWSREWTREVLASLPEYDPSWIPHVGSTRLENWSTIPPINTTVSRTDREEQAAIWLATCKGAQAGKGADGYVLALAITLIHGLPNGEANKSALDLIQYYCSMGPQYSVYVRSCRI
jgi:hypothetical protein